MAKLTAEIVTIIMGLAATHSNRQIADILSSQGVQLSHVTIGKLIKEQRSERAASTKEAVNEHIKKTVLTDLEILQSMRDQLDELRQSPNLKIGQQLLCMDRLNRVIDTRLKYSGAAEPNKKDDVSELTDEELDAELNGSG